jgi:hypothetical protein
MSVVLLPARNHRAELGNGPVISRISRRLTNVGRPSTDCGRLFLPKNNPPREIQPARRQDAWERTWKSDCVVLEAEK